MLQQNEHCAGRMMRLSRLLLTVLGCALASLSTAQWAVAAEQQAAASTASRAKKAAVKAPVKKGVEEAGVRKRVTLAGANSSQRATATSSAVHKVSLRSSAPVLPRGHDEDPIAAFDVHRLPSLASASVLVTNQATGEVLLEKNAESVVPIASITKLMTAMVVLDGQQSLSETVRVTEEDIDTLKGSSSRLPVGAELPRDEMLRLALMASENRAASSLARNYPGGFLAFVAAMNRKAAAIGLTDTHFQDGTGLNSNNVSSARDLTKMVAAASRYPLIREFSTTAEHEVEVAGRLRRFTNTNALVRGGEWEIGLSKTGYISEAGRCLVMQAWLHEKPLIIVLLDSVGKFTRIADAQRIRKWLEAAGAQRIAVMAGAGAS
jgi:serine-type D-Ala-D-Ala endopeptidase (penicillin-binding protein 7)